MLICLYNFIAFIIQSLALICNQRWFDNIPLENIDLNNESIYIIGSLLMLVISALSETICESVNHLWARHMSKKRYALPTKPAPTTAWTLSVGLCEDGSLEQWNVLTPTANPGWPSPHLHWLTYILMKEGSQNTVNMVDTVNLYSYYGLQSTFTWIIKTFIPRFNWKLLIT